MPCMFPRAMHMGKMCLAYQAAVESEALRLEVDGVAAST